MPLIERSVLFGNPDHAAPRSAPTAPTGLSAPHNGVLNVWVGPREKPELAKPVTQDAKRGIRSYFWAFNNRQIIYLQDQGGNENWHVYCVDLASGKTTDLTPLAGVRAEIEKTSDRFPDAILVGLNQRDPHVSDIFQIDLKDGSRRLIQENKDNFSGFVTDEDFHIRLGVKMTKDGGEVVMQPDGQGGWKNFMAIAPEDTMTTSPVGFDKSGNILYLMDSRGRNTGALAAYDMRSGKETVLAESNRADVGGALVKPSDHTIQAVSFNYDRTTWQVLDPAVAADLKVLRAVARGDIAFSSQSLDDQHWIVAYLLDDGPAQFYDYDRQAKKARFLFTSRKDLEGLPLARMHPVVIKSRDGLDLVSYLSLPPKSDPSESGRPSQPLPMVLDVHGGPWARDSWGFNPAHQLWANRGYAVLSVNFRCSTGFGKSFANAGKLQWGAKMQDDLVDAVGWAVAEKIADPKHVAISGGSYGGYATLMGMTKTPELFACGVDIVGPSNLITLIRSIPPYWKPQLDMFRIRMGDETTEAGRRFLEERSPLTHVDRICRPLLIGQGANDPRVKQAEADQIVTAMQRKQIPVTYVLFPDEGHGFARPPNRMAFYAVMEAFLAEHLGGRCQPIGKAFAHSTITIPEGASQVPGLEAGLKEKPAVKGKK